MFIRKTRKQVYFAIFSKIFIEFQLDVFLLILSNVDQSAQKSASVKLAIFLRIVAKNINIALTVTGKPLFVIVGWYIWETKV